MCVALYIISWILRFVARVFISKVGKAVKFVFQQLSLYVITWLCSPQACNNNNNNICICTLHNQVITDFYILQESITRDTWNQGGWVVGWG